MSTSNTGFVVNNGNYSNSDLATLFKPLGSSTKLSYNVGYKPNQTNYPNKNDLSDIFMPIGSATKISNVGYKYSGNDLSNIFQDISYNTFTISNQTNITTSTQTLNGYSVYTFTTKDTKLNTYWITGTCTISFDFDTSVNVILVGGGGGGGRGGTNASTIANGGGGGGGGGGFLKTQIILKANTSYSLQVGSGGVLYTNTNQDGQSSSISGSSISISAFGGTHGGNSSNSSSQTGGTGGTTSTSGVIAGTTTSVSGGSGGNGGTAPTNGGNGQTSYTTEYSTTLSVGGGGGGGINNNTSANLGSGNGSTSGTGGSKGIQNTTPPNTVTGKGYGSGGGGGGGVNVFGGSLAGGYGHSGIVIIYLPAT